MVRDLDGARRNAAAIAREGVRSQGPPRRATVIRASRTLPLSSPFSTVSSRAWVFEVAGCSRRSPLRCAASSTAGARRRVPAAAAKTVHPAAVTCSRGSGLG